MATTWAQLNPLSRVRGSWCDTRNLPTISSIWRTCSGDIGDSIHWHNGTIGHSWFIRTAMVAAFSLTILLFASTIAAKPVVEQNSLVKLSLTRRSNLTAAYNPAKHDRQRIKALNGNTVIDKNLQNRDHGINTPVVNQALFYSASVGVGCPATNCK